MDKKSLKIIYMGTPEFAVEPLRALVNGGYNVVAVVTMPDKPAGRGMKLQSSPVKNFAISCNIPVLQPEKLKDDSFVEELRSYNADLQIVVAFRMLPEIVWSMPPKGTFNLHASLLPQYRGAAPIHWAVINGDKETGVTTFFLKHEIDTGDIIYQEKLAIGADEDTGSVHDRMMLIGSDLVLKTVDAVIENKVSPLPQDNLLSASQLKPAPKLTKDNTRINWNSDGVAIVNLVRGLYPFPGAWTILTYPDGSECSMKIHKADFLHKNHDYTPGAVMLDGKNNFFIAAKDGYVIVERLQLAGGKALNSGDFLRGHTISDGAKAV
jgi:methionyl-tRNA formyltransferase